MRIKVNGQWQQHDEPASVADLLEQMALQPQRVAVERNREIVRRADFLRTQIADDDEIEIVTLVGGG